MAAILNTLAGDGASFPRAPVFSAGTVAPAPSRRTFVAASERGERLAGPGDIDRAGFEVAEDGNDLFDV